jgi:hypothetical protein
MMIYIDSDFKCHSADGGGMRAIDTDMFDGKCQEYIEGYRFVPEGASWVREDGVVFAGLMVAPWKPYDQLATTQAAYERGMAEADEAIAAMIEDIYNADMEEIENV